MDSANGRVVRKQARRWRLFLTALVVSALHPPTPAEAADTLKLEDVMMKGKQVYDNTCVICHQPTGLGLPGTFPPLVAGKPFDADVSVVEPLKKRGFYRDGKMALGEAKNQIDVVLNGIPGTRMFGFGHVLSDEDVASVVTYIRNAWGNDSGEVITPEDVKQFRK